MLGICGVGSLLLASAAMPLTKPGRVTRSCMFFGSWQSTQETGWASPWWAARASRVVAVFVAAPAGLAGVCVVTLDPPGPGVRSSGVPLEVLYSSAWAAVYVIPLISS